MYNWSRISSGINGMVTDMGVDLKLALLFTALTLAFVYIPYINHAAVRFVLGVVTILFIPGYALMAAVFPARDSISGIERFVLSTCFSFAMVPFIGLFLNYTPWGIRLEPITVCLTFLIVTLTLFANKRRHDLPEDQRYEYIFPDFARLARNSYEWLFHSPGNYITKSLVIAAIISLMVLGYVLSLIITAPAPEDRFTELYVVGMSGKIYDYPLSFELGDEKPVIVGISNHEHRHMDYDLIVSLDNGVQNYTLYSGHFKVAPNETLEQPVLLKPPVPGTRMNIEFKLFTDGDRSAPYRECNLWVNVIRPKGKLIIDFDEPLRDNSTSASKNATNNAMAIQDRSLYIRNGSA